MPISAPDPVDAIKFRTYQGGLSVKDLEPIIGKSNRVYEVLNRKRPLTLAMILQRSHLGQHAFNEGVQPGRVVFMVVFMVVLDGVAQLADQLSVVGAVQHLQPFHEGQHRAQPAIDTGLIPGSTPTVSSFERK